MSRTETPLTPAERNDGFTVIELVVVIVLLAVLGALALPRFSNLKDQAVRSNAAAVHGGLRTGVRLANAKWRIDQVNPVQLNGASVDVNADGWPVGGSNAICETTFRSLLQNPPPTRNAAPDFGNMAGMAGDQGRWTATWVAAGGVVPGDAFCAYISPHDHNPLYTIQYFPNAGCTRLLEVDSSVPTVPAPADC